MDLGNNIRRMRFEKGKFVPSALLAFKIAMFFQARVDDVFYIIEN